jgi:hypothetical protein
MSLSLAYSQWKTAIGYGVGFGILFVEWHKEKVLGEDAQQSQRSSSTSRVMLF